jgi:hypothetical protein
MVEPEVGRPCYLVRRSGAGFLVARFCRRPDGGAEFVLRDVSPSQAAGVRGPWRGDGQWRRLWDGLLGQGYVELSAALRSGVVAKDVADSLVAGMDKDQADSLLG